MRTLKLILLRHAEAEEAHGRSDRARTLTRRGEQDAARLGQRLAAEGFAPDLLVSSDGVRARQTAEAVAAALGMGERMTIDPRLYLAGLKEIAATIGELAEAYKGLLGSVVAVGHNPGWSMAAQSLCDVSLELATAEGAEMRIEANDWASALSLTGAWELERVIRP